MTTGSGMLPVGVELFRNRNFSLLWVGALTSSTGSTAVTLVFDWFVFTQTHQVLLLALMGVIEFGPTLTLGVLAGAFVDRHDRRHVMLASDVARAAILGSIAIYVILFGFSYWLLVGAVLAVGILGTFFGPASNALLPKLVREGELTSANGFLQTGATVAQLLGSPLGGALVAFFGAGAALAFNSGTYAISALCVLLLAIPLSSFTAPKPKEERKSIASETLEGFRYIRSQRALLLMTLVSSATNFFSFYVLYLVVYANQVLRTSAFGLGILLGLIAVGGGIGGLIVPRLGLDRTPGIWVPLAWGLSGLPLVALFALPSLPFALASMLSLGITNAFVNVTFLSTVQRVVPDQLLGRYLATTQTLVFAMTPVGIVTGGFLVLGFGVAASFLIAGVGTALLAWSLLLSPSVRRWGAHPSPENPLGEVSARA